MKNLLILFYVTAFCFCSAPSKKVNEQIRNDSGTEKNWHDYIDTINMGFIISFKYPPNCVSEHFENAECIGVKKDTNETNKPDYDGPMNTEDCSIWMDDTTEARKIDTFVQFEVNKLKTIVLQTKDTISIADVKGQRFILRDKNDKSKILKEIVYFTKYSTFFELYNERLSEKNFIIFINSLKIIRQDFEK